MCNLKTRNRLMLTLTKTTSPINFFGQADIVKRVIYTCAYGKEEYVFDLKNVHLVNVEIKVSE